MRKISLTISACAFFCSFFCGAMNQSCDVFVFLPTSLNAKPDAKPQAIKRQLPADSPVAVDFTKCAFSVVAMFPRKISPAKYDANSLSPSLKSLSPSLLFGVPYPVNTPSFAVDAFFSGAVIRKNS